MSYIYIYKYISSSRELRARRRRHTQTVDERAARQTAHRARQAQKASEAAARRARDARRSAPLPAAAGGAASAEMETDEQADLTGHKRPRDARDSDADSEATLGPDGRSDREDDDELPELPASWTRGREAAAARNAAAASGFFDEHPDPRGVVPPAGGADGAAASGVRTCRAPADPAWLRRRAEARRAAEAGLRRRGGPRWPLALLLLARPRLARRRDHRRRVR